MRFSAYTLLAMPLAVMASPVFEKRSSATVLADLKTLLSDVNKLDASVNAFDPNTAPTTTQLVAVVNANNVVSKQQNQTDTDTKSSAAFTAAQSTTIYNYLNKNLYPAVNTLLNDFISHEPGFAKANVKSIVHDNLVSSKTATDQLSADLTKKSTGPSTSNAAALTKKFDTAYNKAIAAYA